MATAGLTITTAGLACLTWWLLGKGNDGAGIANVLALPLTAMGLVATLWGLKSRPAPDTPEVLDAAARAALNRIIAAESSTLQRLIGDSGDAQAADIDFAQPEPVDVRWRTDGGPQEGSSSTITDFYATLDRGRLVILGEPGAGKSVLAIRLLLDIAKAEHRKIASSSRAPARIRVPVRLSLSAFPWPPDSNPDTVRNRLDRWVADHLRNVHGVQIAVALELVRAGWVLPLFDGLDEMSADGSRAALTLQALNLPRGPDRWAVVLTSRPGSYGAGARDTWLQDATVVELRPLVRTQVIDWLAHRFPAPALPGGVEKRWQPVITRIRQHPRGRLATLLSSPLYLYLAASSYHDRHSTPRELVQLDAEQLRNHLFERLVPAVVADHPRRDGTRYAAANVERWLRTFAAHLVIVGEAGGSDSDLHLHELPKSSRKRRSKLWWIAVALAGVVGFYVITQLLGALMSLSSTPTKGLETGGWIGFLTTAGVGVHYILYGNGNPWRLLRIEPRQALTRRGLRALAFGLFLGLVAGISFGFGAGEIVGLPIGLPLGLAAGLALGLTRGLSTVPATAARPSDPLRQSLVHDLTFPVVFVTTVAIFAGPLLSLTFSTFVVVIAALGSPWPRYVRTVLALARRGALPARPGRFLDWAYDAGLVRMSGTATQFRHRELQDHLLAARPAPSSNEHSPA